MVASKPVGGYRGSTQKRQRSAITDPVASNPSAQRFRFSKEPLSSVHSSRQLRTQNPAVITKQGITTSRRNPCTRPKRKIKYAIVPNPTLLQKTTRSESNR